MKQTNSKLRFLLACLVTVTFSVSMISCGSDDDENLENNSSDVAVTGSAYESGATYAKIYGYANIDRLPNSVKVRTIGIQISDEENMDGEDSKTTEELGSDNRFSVTFSYLTPRTKYYYRTYVVGDDGVYRYGNINSFTTAGINNIISRCEVEADRSTATFDFNLNLNNLPDRNKGVYVSVDYGVFYSENRNYVASIDSIYKHSYDVKSISNDFSYEEDDDIDDINDTPSLIAGDYWNNPLDANTTYYYCTFTGVNGQIVTGNVNTFQTLSH